MQERQEEQGGTGLNRRKFLGALGAAAAAEAILERGEKNARANDTTVYFQNSFGDVVPASANARAAGVPLPTLRPGQVPPAADSSRGSCGTRATYVSKSYEQPDILLIMVDQMRAPRWLTSSQQTVVDGSITPNIYNLQQKSYVFPNYFVAATNCTPSRAAILTGLYSQQTCMFVTGSLESPEVLNLNTGYPTIGTVLSQSFVGYDTAWIGKWHVSDVGPDGTGPTDYGFTNIKYSIPNAASGSNYATVFPSPNGLQNQGSGGEFLDKTLAQSKYKSASPIFPCETGHTTCPFPPVPDISAGNHQLNDFAIYSGFENWLAAQTKEPWFCAVSFLNPHDISYFPYAYGLAGSSNEFAFPADTVGGAGYIPPPTAGFKCNSGTSPACSTADTFTIPALDNFVTGVPAGWNGGSVDDPYTQPYLNSSGKPSGKPGVQAFFQYATNLNCGAVEDRDNNGWYTFLDYYYWMERCVDALVGSVWSSITAAHDSGQFTRPIMIVFTSDHGDHGGSHNLHTKGGALYDEVMNVPLYVGFYPNTLTSAVPLAFTCSSVDLLPFFYSMALGNESWRSTASGPSCDIVQYLSGRESIRDAMLLDSGVAKQRRLSSIPVANPKSVLNGQTSQPYILHTMDEFRAAMEHDSTGATARQPPHAIAFRTVDPTVTVASGPATTGNYGGGKLGVYTFWPASCGSWPVMHDQIQYEFYDYTNGNSGETGNDAFPSPGVWNQTAIDYICAFNGIMCAELYNSSFAGGLQSQVQAAYQSAFQAYSNYASSCDSDCGTCTPPLPGSCGSSGPQLPMPSGYTCPG
jgi:arylsulfatase A-like enzyme